MLPLLASVVLLFPYTQNLPPSLYGELALYIGFTLFVQIIANYGIDSYTGIHHYEFLGRPEKLKQFVGSIISVLLGIGLILIIFFTITGTLLFKLVFKEQLSFFPYGFMSVLTGFFNAFFKAHVNFLFYRQKAKRYFIFNLFNFILTVGICMAGLYMYPHTLIGPMWGRLLSGVAIFLLAFYFFMKQYGLHYKPELIKGLNTYCFPVFVYALLIWVVAYINNYIINAMETTADVGIYDFAIKCTLLIETVQVGVLGTINPRIYTIWKRNSINAGTAEENRYYHVFNLFTIVFVAANILLLPLAVRLFVKNSDYYAVFQFLPVLCASFVFRGLYNAYTNPLLYFKKTSSLPKVLAISSAFQIIVSIIFIRYFGIWGAVWSYFLVKPLQVILFRLECKNLFTFNFNKIKMFVLPIFYAAVVLGTYFLLGNSHYFLMAGIQLAVGAIAGLVVFKNELGNIKLLFNK